MNMPGNSRIFDETLGAFVSARENVLAERWPNLADSRLGAVAVFANDEWFAPKERMLESRAARFIADKYDDHGKWMDGWETRRKRATGHDYCIVGLAVTGRIRGFDIDTSHFTGNYPPAASIDACRCNGDPGDSTSWTEILPSIPLKGDSHHIHEIDNDGLWTHVRLNIYPDGGVARLRVYGEIVRDWKGMAEVDLAAIENGGWLVDCSDQHYGSPANILYPGVGASMAEGWETRRRREPGNEWALFRLGCPGIVNRVIVDTTHFKGNYPDRCSIQAATHVADDSSAVASSLFWQNLLPEQKLDMDRVHSFEGEVADLGRISHVRFNMIPDGGVNRLRLFGRPEPA